MGAKGDPEGAEKVMDTAEARLAALGYKQELSRGFNLFTNFAISMSIISILTGITSSFGIAWNNGGPASAVWGWVLVSIMTMFVGVAMAEIVSSLPSSGGPYFWSAELSTPRWSPIAAWVTGYFNLLGQVAVTAGIDFALANHIAAMWTLSNGTVLTGGQLLAVYTILLFTHGVINSLSTRLLALLNAISVVWHVVGTFVIIIVIAAVAPTHQSASFVFSTFYGPDVETSGVPTSPYLFFLGMLMSQFTITGFDACAHMSEETLAADRSAPIAIVMSIGTSAVVGLAYLLALLFSIQDPTTITSGSANGYVAGQIYADAFTARYNGDVTGAIVVLGIPMIAMFFCGMSSVTSNSRMLWSFSRDGATPGHWIWAKVNSRSGTPINAVWGMVFLAFLLGLPLLNSTVAFSAVTSISVIGLYISYAAPILARILNYNAFVPGPFYLGEAGRWIAITAVAWVAFITVVFVLPTAYPVTVMSLNYSPVAVGIVLLGSLLFWFLPGIGGRYWYRGERHTIVDYTVHKKEAEAAAQKAALAGHHDDSAHALNTEAVSKEDL